MTARLSLLQLLKSDLERYYHYHGRPGRSPRTPELWRCFLLPRILPVTIYRLSQAAARRRWIACAKFLTWLNFYLHNIEIAANCDIGSHFFMPHVAGTVIGASRIGDYAVIYHQVTVGAKEIETAYEARPVVGDRVFLASGARVIGAIEIGDDCVIGANAVVTRSADSNQFLAGVPAIARPRSEQAGP
jgi:serine O-acetyltransferase